jgi:signal transduction histidine kinase
MVNSIAFQTRARTIDHLGREQIADCPTAISELWKNSYDAYARKVELRIFDAETPVAAILDNGHGMNYQEFIDKWLVVGTESKFQNRETDEGDRNGLDPRPRQGQKGIGRLSAANLGPLLLLVSKRATNKFVVALLDWRIFENPYLILSDVKVPVAEFEKREELFPLIPDLFELLTENVLGQVRGKKIGEVQERNDRISLAWKMYDTTTLEGADGELSSDDLPSNLIIDTLIQTSFNTKHIENWDVWKDSSKTGTALLIADIDYDLKVHLTREKSPTIVEAKQRFVETLSSFVDPFFDPNSLDVNSVDTEFEYAVYTHIHEIIEPVVSRNKDFNRSSITDMEHVIEGTVDDNGVFHGKVKAFGEWVDISNECIIEPQKDLNIPSRSNSRVGSFDIFISTFEQIRGNSTHSDLEFNKFRDFAEYYSGFLVFRNGLRVLPYGRTDNDFFQIEMRRSKRAGAEFWSSRRMFGRLGLSSDLNKNLKDKAGREGFIDNVAAKTLKLLVENILSVSAKEYFGSDSEIRVDRLPEVQAANRENKAKEARTKLRSKNRKLFRGRLRKTISELPVFLEGLQRLSSDRLNDIDQVVSLQEKLDEARNDLSNFRLPGVPKPLGSLEDDYSIYLRFIRDSNKLVHEISLRLEIAIDRIKPAKPVEILEKQRQRYAGQLHSKIRKWKSVIAGLQQYESERVVELVGERNKIFHTESEPIFIGLKKERLTLVESMAQLEKLRLVLDEENAEIFESYIGALESLSESIDLEILALATTEQNDELRLELDRLNGLAQLGITVEILAHELVSYDDMIGMGIRNLPKVVQKSKAVKDIRIGYEGLSSQLQFLSPLQLSGQKIRKWLTGEDIFEYVKTFFSTLLSESEIQFDASPEFKKFRVFEHPSRLYPVFINMINNSVYWVNTIKSSDKRIQLAVVDQKIVISDSGPGVEELDIPKLFSLFFTKKTRGGRGVGLYLARANLSPGGHKIKYAVDEAEKVLDGANFTINFKGAEYG